MKKLVFLVAIVLGFFGPSFIHAQESLTFPFPGSADPTINDVVVFGDRSGIAFTDGSIFRTDNSGENWRTLPLPIDVHQHITSVLFENETHGSVAISDLKFQILKLARTTDGGQTWTVAAVDLENSSEFELDIESASFSGSREGSMELSIRIPTSSNFDGRAVYRSADGGNTWEFVTRSIELNRDEEASALIRKGTWTLEATGECAGFKTGCVQETKLFIAGKNATPPGIRELARAEKDRAINEAANAPKMFALPPGGSTRISLQRGFDKCQAGTVAQMQLWWDNSYFHDTNIYFSGRARACPTQPFTNNPAWIDAVSAQGWGLIPTVVGYQAPCSVSTTIHKHSSDPVIAEQQGRGEADIAVTDANSIGLTTGSVIYYDMERYNEPGDGTCTTAVKAFLKGWTERIHELGYLSGVYGSPSNAVPDWWPMPAASRMDAIWMARWDNVMSVWVYNSPSPAFPAGAWENHQRIKQWQAPHNETWGSVTFNIDGNISDGPVAGLAVPRNRNADFDGDLNSDISVWRPENGVWYVLNSLNGAFTATAFGIATDIPMPGDYDGDGKTDRAVFRPTDGFWHMLTKGNIYSARPFGSTGDVPAAADYNGDGKTDVAVFRPSSGTWYIANSDSRATITIMQFGLDGDKPVPADYDADGKADIAIYRPNGATGGEWWIQRSTLGLFATQFGGAADKPIQGDYTGDGKADIAFFQPSSGFWYVLRSEDYSYFAFPFGVSTDIPAPGDFDGDGKFDAAVFRPSEGTWYANRSTAGILIIQFGAQGDKPVPSAYIPQQ